MLRSTNYWSWLALLALTASQVRAGEETTRIVQGFVGAELIERPGPPRYPPGELQRGREGWVRVSFIVGVDGKPSDVVVEDSNGLWSFERAALGWIDGLRYRPAMLDGNPVSQAFNGYKIQFDLAGDGEGVTRRVMTIYRRGSKALREGDFEEVRAQLARADERTGLDLYEEAWLSILRGRLCDETQDLECKLAAFDAVLSFGADTLERDVLSTVATTKFAAELRSGRLRDARRTLERIRELELASDALEPLATALAEAEAVFASDTPLRLVGTLTRRSANEASAEGLWVHAPTRRMPALMQVDGVLAALEIRCDVYQSRVEAPEVGRAWRIPESWGDCQLYFIGEPGTRLLVEEMHPG
jgi:TonB family protein